MATYSAWKLSWKTAQSQLRRISMAGRRYTRRHYTDTPNALNGYWNTALKWTLRRTTTTDPILLCITPQGTVTWIAWRHCWNIALIGGVVTNMARLRCTVLLCEVTWIACLHLWMQVQISWFASGFFISRRRDLVFRLGMFDGVYWYWLSIIGTIPSLKPLNSSELFHQLTGPVATFPFPIKKTFSSFDSQLVLQ